MKKRIFLLLIIVLLVPVFDNSNHSVYATSVEEEQFGDVVDEQLSNVDLSDLQQYLDSLDSTGQQIFGNNSIMDKIQNLLSGEMDADFGSFLSMILNILFGNITDILPIFCIILAVGILYNLIGSLVLNNNGTKSIVEFVCFGVVVVIVSGLLFNLLQSTHTVISNIKGQMDALFPILLTLVASVGGAVSVGIFQPMTAILSNGIVQIFSILIMPLFTFCFVFSVVGNISDSVKLDKFQSLFDKIFKWIVRGVFGIFSALLVLQGLLAGSYDGLSVRATKFAIKNYVPLLGGYLSDGFNLVAGSSVLIKNCVGVVGLFLLFGTILGPILDVVVFAILMHLSSAILQSLGVAKMSKFLEQTSKLSSYLLTIIIAVGFVYILSIGMLMCIANIV